MNKQPVTLAGLTARLQDIFATRREKTLFLVGAPSLPYREVVKVIDAAKAAGIAKVGVVTGGMRAQAGVPRRRLAFVRAGVAARAVGRRPAAAGPAARRRPRRRAARR